VLLAVAGTAAADLQIRAHVDRAVLAPPDHFTYTVEVQGSVTSTPSPKLPDLSDFSVLSGPNQSSTFQFINGRTSYTKSYSLVLRPRREGTLTIAPAEVTHDGKLYRSDSLTLTVSGAGAPPAAASPPPGSPAPPPATDNGEDLFVQVTADQRQAYQGEAILLTYTLYTRVSVQGYDITQVPRAEGFWTEEFPPPPTGPEVRDVTLSGRVYKAAMIRRVAVFPTRSGDLVVDPLEATCQVQVEERPRRTRDPFDMLFNSPFLRYRTEQRAIKTAPLKIKVLPLPEAGRPADFSGAVGQYGLKVTLDRHAARTNEALTMTVHFSGSGNLKMLPPPDYPAPPDFEMYEPKESLWQDKSKGKVSGTKTFEYVLIPRFAGTQKIPPVRFTFFNPATKKYETLEGGGFEIAVEQGASTPAAAAPGLAKEEVKLLGQDIHYLKSPGRLRPLGSGGLPLGYHVGMILPPLLALALLAGARVLGMPTLQARLRSRRAYLRAQNELRRLGKSPGAAGFYGGVHRALLGYLGEKLKLPAQGLKEDEVLDHLEKRDLPSAPVERVRGILQACNYARFAPGSEEASRQDQVQKEALAILEQMEENWDRV